MGLLDVFCNFFAIMRLLNRADFLSTSKKVPGEKLSFPNPAKVTAPFLPSCRGCKVFSHLTQGTVSSMTTTNKTDNNQETGCDSAHSFICTIAIVLTQSDHDKNFATSMERLTSTKRLSCFCGSRQLIQLSISKEKFKIPHSSS